MKYILFFAIFLTCFFSVAGFAGAVPYPYPYPYPYQPCNSHAYRDCYGGSVYWYNSCGQVENLYQNCYSNTFCQYGQCVYQQYIPPAPNPNPYNPYATTACYGNNVYWYDSLGVASGLYKSCADANSCTQDSCYSGKCSNVLKCDGSACAAGSADYNSYCQQEKPAPAPAPAPEPAAEGLSVSFFSKQDLSSIQWQKTGQVGQNSQVYFLVSVANNSKNPIDNVIVSASIPSEVGLLGNIQVDNMPATGDIVAGISIGSLAPMSAKVVNFEGKTQEFSGESAKEAKATVSAGQVKLADGLSLSFVPGQVAGIATSSNGLWDFVRRWYVWILAGAVLIFLFFVVFRRLSSNA